MKREVGCKGQVLCSLSWAGLLLVWVTDRADAALHRDPMGSILLLPFALLSLALLGAGFIGSAWMLIRYRTREALLLGSLGALGVCAGGVSLALLATG